MPESSDLGLRRLFVFALLCAALNVILIAVLGGYNTHLGPLWFTAHNLFKPLMLLNGLFLIALIRAETGSANPFNTPSRAILPLTALALYAFSLTINFQHHDWTHRHISADLPTFASLGRLFTETKADGFYRPIGFVSLWVDFRIFGNALWGYHLQNIILHMLNTLLVARFAGILGYSQLSAWGAGLLFSTAPTAYEPVVWPAARFDMLSTFFTLAALNAAPKSLPLTLAAFSLGVLSKESAYAFIPMLLVLGFVIERARWVRALVGALALSAVFLAIRFSVYAGWGIAYSGVTALNRKTLIALITRVPTLPLFAIDSSTALPVWARADVVAFALAAAALVLLSRASISRRDLIVIALVFASALPVANLVGWISPNLLNARFLYLPSAMLAILIGAALARANHAVRWLSALALICGIAAFYNEIAYPAAIQKTTLLSGMR